MTDITYYVAMPFTEDDNGGAAPGAAEEFQSPSPAIRRAEVLSRMPGMIGAVAFSRSGDPMLGEFKDAVVIKTFGDLPADLGDL